MQEEKACLAKEVEDERKKQILQAQELLRLEKNFKLQQAQMKDELTEKQLDMFEQLYVMEAQLWTREQTEDEILASKTRLQQQKLAKTEKRAKKLQKKKKELEIAFLDKDKTIESLKEQVDDQERTIEALNDEIGDIQAEFETERRDYLDTIRDNDRQRSLYTTILKILFQINGLSGS